jgi:hypothetical protein
MTEGEQEPKKIVVPGTGGYDDDDGEVLVRPEDIESTSRSCLAIIIILIIIAAMICAFLAVQPFLD